MSIIELKSRKKFDNVEDYTVNSAVVASKKIEDIIVDYLDTTDNPLLYAVLLKKLAKNVAMTILLAEKDNTELSLYFASELKKYIEDYESYSNEG
jgi:hypothetical protein